MKRLFPLLAWMIWFSPAVSGAIVAPVTWYVSPEGSDLFSGRMPHNNATRTDGPFATVAHARDVVREMRAAAGGRIDRPVNIVLRGGTYWLDQPLLLLPIDSGTESCPVTYSAYAGETPVLNAGRPVRGWGPGTLNGHAVWIARLPAFRGADQAFEELWVNDRPRHPGRLPHTGFFRVASVPDRTASTPLQHGQKRFVYSGDDLHSLPDITDAQAVVMSLWAESHLPIESVDEAGRVVRFTRASVLKMDAGDRYFVQGAREMVQEPGEWWFDRPTATLYYMPFKGERMLETRAVVPWHEQIVRLQGSGGRFVRHVVFRGITFTGSEWSLPRHDSPGRRSYGSGFPQAAIGVPGALWAEGARDCTFDDCVVTDAGNYGIELAAGCQDDVISHCRFERLGAGGIKIGPTSIHMSDAVQTRRNRVTDCTIADCGSIYPSSVGLWLGQTDQNLISHNDIHGLWYTAISVGWTWGYGPALARDNLIEFNHVHHIGSPADGVEPVLSDMGAIYTLGRQPGTVIRGNVFHDIAGLRYGGWGIYFDEGTSGVLAENNLVYRTTHGGFHQHYGADNIVRNNIFAFGRDAQMQRTRLEDHLSFHFERNLVVWDRGKLLAGTWPKNVAFDHNTYWRYGGGDIRFAGLSWEQWRRDGLDLHSQIADPRFIDPEHGDFQLPPDASARLEGFVPFETATVGPRPLQSAETRPDRSANHF